MRILTTRNVKGMVKFKDAFEIPACVFMEFIPGMTLKEAVYAKVLDSLEKCLKVLIQIGEVVHTAHNLEERVLHRDLKPENVILRNCFSKDDDIDAVVLDFDLSWHKGAVDLSIDRSPGYAAPEQTAAGRKKGVSARHTAVDVFSLGMLAYFLFIKADPRPTEHLVEGFAENIKTSVMKRFRPEWQYLPIYLTQTIIGCTKDVQAERIPFPSAVEAFRTCYQVILTDSIRSNHPLLILEIASRLDPTGKFAVDSFGRHITVFSPDGSKEVHLHLENVGEDMVVRITFSKVRSEFDPRYVTDLLPKAEERTKARLKGKFNKITSHITTGRLDVRALWSLSHEVSLAEIESVADIISEATSAMELQQY